MIVALPLYSPKIPSFLTTLKKQSILFLYMISPAKVPRWFCIRVLTRSMGYTAVAPAAVVESGRKKGRKRRKEGNRVKGSLPS